MIDQQMTAAIFNQIEIIKNQSKTALGVSPSSAF
jgi:hypothetical protein